MKGEVTLLIRPSLALPERWSVDCVFGTGSAAYQASLLTHPSAAAATAAADQLQVDWKRRGGTVKRRTEPENASRNDVELPSESEEAIAKRLEKYVEDEFAQVRTFSIAEAFNIANWGTGLKAIATRSPVSLSLVILLALALHGTVESFLVSILPTEFGVAATYVLPASPVLVVTTALLVHFRQTRASSQLDKVRIWILQLTVFFGWRRERFMEIAKNELHKLEFASLNNFFEDLNQRDPGSFTKLSEQLSATIGVQQTQADRQIDTKTVAAADLPSILLRDDFARKIQALAALGREGNYTPRRLAVSPLLLLISLNSVKTTMQGLLGGRIGGIEQSRVFQEAMALIGVLFGMLLTAATTTAALVWTSALASRISALLFAADLAASAITMWLLTARPIQVAFKRNYIPRGLALHECMGALAIYPETSPPSKSS